MLRKGEQLSVPSTKLSTLPKDLRGHRAPPYLKWDSEMAKIKKFMGSKGTTATAK